MSDWMLSCRPERAVTWICWLFNTFIMMTCQIMHDVWFWHSGQGEQVVHPVPFLNPARQKLGLRRLAASDLAQFLLSKVVWSHLAKADNTVRGGFLFKCGRLKYILLTLLWEQLTALAGCYVDLKKQTPNLKIFEEFRSSSAHWIFITPHCLWWIW